MAVSLDVKQEVLLAEVILAPQQPWWAANWAPPQVQSDFKGSGLFKTEDDRRQHNTQIILNLNFYT